MENQEKKLTGSIGTERLYNLGDFKSIKFSHYLTGIPKEVVFNEHIMDLLRLYQLVDVETAFERYVQLAIDKKKAEEGENVLEYEKSETYEALRAELFREEVSQDTEQLTPEPDSIEPDTLDADEEDENERSE